MSNENRFTASCTYAKGNASANWVVAGSTDVSGQLYSDDLQIAGLTDTLLDFGSIGSTTSSSLGFFMILNTDTTNYVEIGFTTSAIVEPDIYPIKLLPGGEPFMARSNAGVYFHAKANTAPVALTVRGLDA
jgi:hypothetical protein